MQIAIVPFINLMVPLVVSATLIFQAAAMMAPVTPPSIREHQSLYELTHVVAILSTLTTFGTVANSRASQGQPMMDMEMTGSVSPFLFRMGRSRKFSTISTVDSTHVFVAHLRVKGNDQLCTLEKLLMGLTMLNVMADVRLSNFSDLVASGVLTIAKEAVGTGMTSGILGQSSVMFSLSHCVQVKLLMAFSVLQVMCAVSLPAEVHLHDF